VAPRIDADGLEHQPLWYKDAVIYQLHVRAFFDSNGDGIGDFKGLTEKLDYLEDLGVTAVWLLPFYPSPLKDDGYDIADYTDVHHSYGTLRDFHTFLREAHRRGLRVITELVINHTSDQHLWFQRARRAPRGSRERDFYVWSDTVDRYTGARIIFKDFEPSNWSADPVAGQYFWHRFYAHQPDLNFDSPAVQKEVFEVMDFWLGAGVDGLRLDAIPYLYEREGTSCENLPETHRFLKELRRHIDRKYEGRMLLAEANQWPEDAVPYFGDGDECHMSFHFPLMPRMFMAIRMEDRFPVLDILAQTPAIPDTAQWAMFLRNHDELTLEMVTDSERDYMYQAYARDREMRINLGIRRRLAPLMGNDRRAIELMNALLFSLPGTPVIYYGDEIGMGDNVYLGDRNGVRTPMQWSADRNAGFSRANPHRLFLPIVIDSEYHYEAVNVEAQQNNPRSLYWWMKHLIALRKRVKAFGRGSLEFVRPANSKVLAFVRAFEDERMLVVANVSRFAQSAELDLGHFRGLVPVELFGQTRFPVVGEHAYPMTLGPYAVYWFGLESPRVEAPALAIGREGRLPRIEVTGNAEKVFSDRPLRRLERYLPEYLRARRWFAGKARRVQAVRVLDDVRVSGADIAHLLLLQVEYSDHKLETYVLPLAFATGDAATRLRETTPEAVLLELDVRGQGPGLLYDALWDEAFARTLLDGVARRRRWQGRRGTVVGSTNGSGAGVLTALDAELTPAVTPGEQSNTTLAYGDRVVLKLFRRLELGVNPELELGRLLSERLRFANVPPLVGALEYQEPGRAPITIAVAQGFVANEGDAWQYTVDYLGRFYERAAAKTVESMAPPPTTAHPLDALEDQPPAVAKELMGFYLERVRLLGQRTAELHRALVSERHDPALAPEEVTDFFRRSQYQGLRGLAIQTYRLLRQQIRDLPEPLQDEAASVLDREKEVLDRFLPVRDRRFRSLRIRTHGDYHLAQVLFTGKDFVVIDFEGEPARSFSERRNKTFALRDVAGMLRSFHYASFAAASGLAENARPVTLEEVEPWRRLWYHWTAVTFLRSYLGTAAGAPFLADDRVEWRVILDAYLLDKAVYELAYELNHRPAWVGIPLRGILEVLGDHGMSEALPTEAEQKA
jgi:maltose alpha-D-glucosyltransferase/alpha-amylase